MLGMRKLKQSEIERSIVAETLVNRACREKLGVVALRLRSKARGDVHKFESLTHITFLKDWAKEFYLHI